MTQPIDYAYIWRLFSALTWNEFKMRYYGSVLGYLWSLLKPLALFVVLYIVFTVYMKIDTPYYKLNLLLGMMIWNFFAEASGAGILSIISRYTLVRKIYFPRLILVASSVSTPFIGLLLNLLVFGALAAWEQLPLRPEMFLIVPLLLCLYLTTLGISMILSVLIIQVRDMGAIWDLAIQIGFWGTPVIYPMSLVPEKWRFFLFLNPMAGILEYSRFAMTGTGQLTLSGVCFVLCSTFFFFGLGLWVFFNREPVVVEEL